MKKIFYLVCIIFIMSVFLIVTSGANAVRVKFPHNLSGKILSIDFEGEKPQITVEYFVEDEYYKTVRKEMELRLNEDTKIADKEGKEVERNELKVGDTVSLSYKVRYVGDGTPLWKEAQTITIDETSE